MYTAFGSKVEKRTEELQTFLKGKEVIFQSQKLVFATSGTQIFLWRDSVTTTLICQPRFFEAEMICCQDELGICIL